LRLNNTNTGLYYLEEVPTLLMLTLYTQQVLKLAEVYHLSVGEQERYTKRILHWFVVGNCAVVLFQLAIWCAYFETKGRVDPDVWSVVAASVHAASFATAAGAMGMYGSLNNAFLAKLSMGVAERRVQLRQSLLLSAPCTLALLIRSIALAGASWANLLNWNSVRDTVTAGDAVVSILVYFFTEIVPLGAILYFNRLRGRTRVSLPGDVTARGGPATALLSAGGGQVSPSAVRTLRFNFSPKKVAPSLGEGTAEAEGEGVSLPKEPRQPPPLPPPPIPEGGGSMGTGKVVRGLFGMVLVALGVRGSGEASGTAGEKTSLLGAKKLAAGRARMLGGDVIKGRGKDPYDDLG